MGINIGGRAEIRVAEPFLDLLQRHAVGRQKTGAAAPKLMIDENRSGSYFDHPALKRMSEDIDIMHIKKFILTTHLLCDIMILK